MAIMHPRNVVEFTNLTEKRFYYSLKEQLPDEYDVYYSVTWYDNQNGGKVNSEADFVITHRTRGFLCIEVKGGANIIHDGEKYKIVDEYGDTIYEKNISPYEQAENSMWYFLKLYSEKYGEKFDRAYGFVAAFPNFSIKSKVGELFYQVSETTIDCNDMQSLKQSIEAAFLYFGKQVVNKTLVIENSMKNLHELFKRIYAIEASKGALISIKEKELAKVNDVQDNIINLLINYKTFAIKGAAGTGKSWMAYKMAVAKAYLNHQKTLLLSKSDNLSKYFREKNNISQSDWLDVISYSELLNKIDVDKTEINNKEIDAKYKYEVIIVDEAQDFDYNEAFFLRSLVISKNSEFYIFYDDEQNIYSVDLDKTLENFMIETPPYILTENLRNTRNIYEWVKVKTPFAKQTFTNQIDGPDPKVGMFNSANQIIKYINKIISGLIEEDEVPMDYIKIIIDDEIYDLFKDATWEFNACIDKYVNDKKNVGIMRTSDFKGLESNVIIYVHKHNSDTNYAYVGLTRARFYLYDIQLKS